MKCLLPALTAVFAVAASGQNAPTQPQFDVADVHVSAPGTEEGGEDFHGGRLEFRGVTMLHLIMAAYSIEEDDRVLGGPGWLDTDRYDIIARSPAATSPDDVRLMLQGLLASRFNLAIHHDQKPLPVWILSMSKRSSQLKEGSGDSECKLTVPDGVRTYTCHNMTMAGLAERLPRVAGGYFSYPVVDQTGLKGGYDFTVKWVPRGQLTAAGHSGDGGDSKAASIFDHLDKQLGLKAEVGKQPLPVIVVDRVNQKPTNNAPGVTEKLPPPPTEFEVADVRPSKPGTKQNVNIRNGRLEARSFSLKELIVLAYDVEDKMVTGGEKWLDADKFDIVAKSQPTASFEALRAMLRTLLEQRFKLKAHKEDQPMPAYALTAGKRPKLTESDGKERGACKLGVEDGLRSLTCANTTMAQFAEKIRSAAAAYLDHPVVDETGLTGTYDFVVKWTGKGRVMGTANRAGDAAPSAPAGTMPAAAEPSNALTVFEAVDRQLGLKFVAQKHPLPVVVVEHVERTPTEN